MISVREYAEGRGISRQAVFKRLKRIGKEAERIGRSSYLSDDLAAALDDSYQNPLPRKPRTDSRKALSDRIQILEEENRKLREQLEQQNFENRGNG